RDFHVTGVQTCALPICRGRCSGSTCRIPPQCWPTGSPLQTERDCPSQQLHRAPTGLARCCRPSRCEPTAHGLSPTCSSRLRSCRSEERRVGTVLQLTD